jgi:hypothetical protein
MRRALIEQLAQQWVEAEQAYLASDLEDASLKEQVGQAIKEAQLTEEEE